MGRKGLAGRGTGSRDIPGFGEGNPYVPGASFEDLAYQGLGDLVVSSCHEASFLDPYWGHWERASVEACHGKEAEIPLDSFPED